LGVEAKVMTIRFELVLGIAVFALLSLVGGTRASAQEDPGPFIFAEDELPDFIPSSSASVAGFRGLVVLPGSTEDAGGNLDAALVARSAATREEAWRVERGVPGLRDRFFNVAVARGRVCVSGIGERPFPQPDVILVGCYRARDGAEIWAREVSNPALFFPNHELEILQGGVFVRISSTLDPVVLRFKLLDGAP
jgi:hypothetical protein